jgi:hypothetical protein
MENLEFIKNNIGIKIKSEHGFVEFDGIRKQQNKKTYRVKFTNETYIDVTHNHRFFEYNTSKEVFTQDLYPGIELVGDNHSRVEVESVNFNKVEDVYDIINSQTHTYMTNGVLSHNCHFLSSDALLISSHVLNNIVTKNLPEPDQYGIHWFDTPTKGQNFLIGVDPSTGTGSDMSSIEIFEFPSLIQYGEFRSNTTSSSDLYKTLKYAIRSIERLGALAYFSVENNGVGEGIIALYQNDDNPPEAHFVSEVGKGRLGMTTTGKSKAKACNNLKELITKGKMGVKSKPLLAELKTYVRKMGTYAAQYGSTDDSISATLIIVRIIEEISMFEDKAFELLYQMEEIEDGYDQEQYDETEQGTPMVYTQGYGHVKPRGTFTDPNDPNSFDPFGGM